MSIEAMDRWRGVLLVPWQTSLGQGLLLAFAIVHAGLASLAALHSLAMSRTDRVQLLLGLVIPPLLVNHVATRWKRAGIWGLVAYSTSSALWAGL